MTRRVVGHPGRRIACAVLLAVATCLSAAPADAQQYQHGNVAQYWTLPVLAWNVDTYVWPALLSPSVFFAQQFWFDDGGVAYVGILQEDDGRLRARFSIWNATTAQRSRLPGAECDRFTGEGVGMGCVIPYAFGTGRWYRLRVWRLNETSRGRWWGAWVFDEEGNESHIGSILAPRGQDLVTGSVSFNEYYGTAVGYPCGRLPPSTVYFYQPILNARRSRAAMSTSDAAPCSAGRVTRLWNGRLSKLALNDRSR